jgi:hypothetical protein
MQQEHRSADQVMKIVTANPDRLEALRQNPLPELQKLTEEAKAAVPAWTGDKWLFRGAVLVLGLLAMIAAIGSLWLALGDTSTPEVLVSLGSAAVGALVGLFAPSPVTK